MPASLRQLLRLGNEEIAVYSQIMTPHDQLVDVARVMADTQVMLTGSQIRAALGLLRKEVSWLAKEAGISESTVRRAIGVDGEPKMHTDSLGKIQRALEAQDVLFLDVGDIRTGGSGVRWRRP